MHLNVAQLQTRVCDSKKENLQKLEVLLEKACKEKADLITLPEMFCCPYETERFPVYAEETGGEAYSFCARLAEKYQIYLSAGSIPERDEAGRILPAPAWPGTGKCTSSTSRSKGDSILKNPIPFPREIRSRSFPQSSEPWDCVSATTSAFLNWHG